MQNILIICGGKSAEHEISIISARNVIAALDRSLFNPIIIVVGRSGSWYKIQNESQISNIKECPEPFSNAELCSLFRKPAETVLITESRLQEKIDCIFPLIHGPMGEDGTLQGLLEIMSLPYVGSGVFASALCMDKVFCKQALKDAGIPITPFVSISDKNLCPTYFEACKIINSDILFIKAASMGSSVGVYKVKSEKEFVEAIENSFKYGRKILIEAFIPCREIECAVIGNTNPEASCLGEIKPTHEFYSYASKYTDPNGAEYKIPASLPDEITEKIREFAIKSFQATECKGMARVDFFLSNDNAIYVNELNTIPGFTSISMYPQLWQASGLGYTDLISKLIDLAYEEYNDKQKICLVP